MKKTTASVLKRLSINLAKHDYPNSPAAVGMVSRPYYQDLKRRFKKMSKQEQERLLRENLR